MVDLEVANKRQNLVRYCVEGKAVAVYSLFGELLVRLLNPVQIKAYQAFAEDYSENGCVFCKEYMVEYDDAKYVVAVRYRLDGDITLHVYDQLGRFHSIVNTGIKE